MHRIVFATLLSLALPVASPASAQVKATKPAKPARTPDCVYVGTPHDVIDKMLELADLKKDDVVYDLGCGDGRIMVAAARRAGCRSVGYDINPLRIEEALENIRTHGVGRLVTVEQEDIFTVDLRPASVVMLYLLPDMNLKLVPQLEELAPGSRIVIHDYDIEGIEADKSVTMTSLEDNTVHYVYLYTAPLKKEP
jgi:predicted RNA methylase